MTMRANNQVFQDNYDYELMKIMEQERQLNAGQVGDRRLFFLSEWTCLEMLLAIASP